MTVAVCHGIARSGQRCRARPIVGSQWCINHDPSITDAQRKAWAAKGGRNSATQARARKQLPTELLGLDEVDAYMGMVFRQVIVGKLDPKIGTAAANIAGTIKELRKAALEDRIDELERALGMKRIGA